MVKFQEQDTLNLERLLLRVRRRNELSLKITELATGHAQNARRKVSALLNEIVAETEASLRQSVSQTRENIRFLFSLLCSSAWFWWVC
ncbi:MAG: hypothetical protein HC913_12220 [Microscillaceae bacterium]|nr:hypothetical protein [Microscillaceae bacterium]